MRERLVTVRNHAGIHCRPSGVILYSIKNEFPDHSFHLITGDGTQIDVDSILALLSAALSCGTSAVLQVEGIDEDKAIKRIGDLFEHEFDFPPRQ